MAGDSRCASSIAYEVRGFITVEQARRFLLNALRVGNPGYEKLWPEVEGRVEVHARRKRVVKGRVEGAVRGVRLVEAEGVKRIDYVSASGRSRLTWRRLPGGIGELSGVASPWTLRNLHLAGVNLNLLEIRPTHRGSGGYGPCMAHGLS